MGPGAAEREREVPADPVPASRVAQVPRAQAPYRSESRQNLIASQSNETFRWSHAQININTNLEKN